MRMKKLPNEGRLKPCKFYLDLWSLEKGDTFNIESPCTLTYLETIQKDSKIRLVFEVSDVKFECPPDDQLYDIPDTL